MIQSHSHVKIEIDVLFNTSNELLGLLEHWTQLELTYKIIKAKGPAGGWPIIELLGDESIIIGELKRMNYEDINTYVK